MSLTYEPYSEPLHIPARPAAFDHTILRSRFWSLLKGSQGYHAHKKGTPLGSYHRPMPRVLGGAQGGGRFLMGEVPLYSTLFRHGFFEIGKIEASARTSLFCKAIFSSGEGLVFPEDVSSLEGRRKRRDVSEKRTVSLCELRSRAKGQHLEEIVFLL